MQTYPKVSIIIPFYNCQYVDQAIESALNQTYPNIEVVVVNDGSIRYTDKIRPYKNRIRYVEKSNGGTGSALNAGIRQASGEYFSWLSSDDLYEKDKVAKQIAYMQQTGASACYSSYVHIDAQNQVISGPAGIYYPNKMEFYRTMQRGCFINGCTVMLRMDVFRQVGLFNESLKYTQDYDLWMRVLFHFDFEYLNEPIVKYRVHEAMGTKNFEPAIQKEILKVQATYYQALEQRIAKERLTVIIPILTLSMGGAQRMLAELANGLTRLGHQVMILMPQNGAIEYSIQAKIVRTRQPYTIEEHDYPYGDVIISNFYSLVPAAESASRNGKGVHVRLSLCYEPTFLPDNHITFPTYHVTKHLIVLSSWQQQLIKLNHGIEGHIVPVGVSSSFTNYRIRKPHEQIQISAILRIPEGGYSWHREQSYLVEQLEKVHKAYPQVRINLFSPPNEFAASVILKQIKASHPAFRYLTPANDTELCYHYNETDIFVNSSTYDTASLPGLEAMKCGAALVSTYGGGNLDYIRHEKNGLMSYRFEQRLASDVIRLIENPTLRNQLAEAGEQEAKQWTWERSVHAFEKALRQIAEKN
ncbi:glycosyltransferase [Paenibacillus hexagrammi]|uniref:Glycosyltransferase n=1 Tax=Paenibacillus hexagrammi TaxID=2908839 RepID=A0ABY3SRP9_9BACL|nr:glycosyltransferase [Paenibacillus sp. YPD9-1]UJF35785.1 glycosyltransferase [Paenibacillus sp. YPD9-1]